MFLLLALLTDTWTRVAFSRLDERCIRPIRSWKCHCVSVQKSSSCFSTFISFLSLVLLLACCI